MQYPVCVFDGVFFLCIFNTPPVWRIGYVLTLFHSFDEIPACLKISETKAREISPLCGFGIRSLNSPR